MKKIDPKLKRRLKTGLKVLPFIAIAAFAIYRMKFAPVPAEIVPVKPGPIVSEVLGNGAIRAEHHALVGAEIQGRIIELAADRNDVVKEGAILARLEEIELLADLDSARRFLDASKAAVLASDAEKARADAVFQQAGRDHVRFENLFREGVISKAEFERSAERLEIARAEKNGAASRMAEAAARAEDAEKKLEARRARLGYTVIRAPFSGIVITREREIGDVVVPGTTLYQIVDPTDIRVSAWVDETAIAGVEVGKPARVFFRSEPEKGYPGTVVEVERNVDPETREFRVDVRTASLPAGWAVGQRADVYIERQRKEGVLSVPLRAVILDGGIPHILVLEDGRAKKRRIGTGIRGLDGVEVTEGLSPGERVVIPGPGVVSGKRVEERR